MKRHQLSMITSAIALGLASQAAFAEYTYETKEKDASVAFFAVLDGGVRTTKNGTVGTVTSEMSGSNMSSRWGVKGTRKMSDDAKASFWLESAVAANTGAAGTTTGSTSLFDRRTTFSLTSNKFGEVRLGRDYVPTFLAMSASDPFTAVGIGATNILISPTATKSMLSAFGGSSSANTTGRFNNSIQYFSPNTWNGVYLQLVQSLGASAATSATGNSDSKGLRFGYDNGKLNTSYAYLKTDNTLVSGQSFTDSVLTASYDFGIVKLSLTERDFKFISDKQATTWLAAIVPVPNGLIKVSKGRANQSGTTAALNANDADILALGYIYNYSNDIAFYAHTARVNNKGQSIFTLTGGPSVTAANFGGQTSSGQEFGVRLKF